MKQASREDFINSMVAGVITMAIMFFFARVLLHRPAAYIARQASDHAAMQVYFVRRAPPAQPLAQQVPPAPQAPARQSRHEPQRSATPAPSVPARRETSTTTPQVQLYTRDGGVRIGTIIDPMDPGHAAVPPGMTDERELAKAKKLLERPNPIEYKETRFAKDWVSDGTVGDIVMQEMNRGMKKATEKIFGKDVEAVKARPPPDVRFNPALAENKADLGSEATGDAYKAAPIAHEKPPMPYGEASRRIGVELAALEQLASSCDASGKQALLAPVRTHLSDLQRTEHALGHGADPVMAAQMLPRQADSAYNLARRALWYARKHWTTCGS